LWGRDQVPGISEKQGDLPVIASGFLPLAPDIW
jgi:hypothetical protein